ncbi:MAG: PEP-CTERM sorting domain-containing protein [Lentisphaeria bacterium]|nr:PEP-CTERM sorting domain-containing protein [Lentisphaeria bacterium]
MSTHITKSVLSAILQGKLFALSLAALILPAAWLHAATVSLDFEGESAGSGTPPSGWSLITVAGSPTYVTSAAGGGSNGTGGSSGLAGQVSSTAFVNADLPGAYLVNSGSKSFDLNSSVTGSFDFQIVHEGTFDDIVFVLGDVADGITTTNAGELLSMKVAEVTSTGVAAVISDGVGDEGIHRLATTGTTTPDDTWHRITFSWTPTSGLTGDFTYTVNNFSSDLFTLNATGFTFDNNIGYIGFGSVNDTIRFDNVSVTGAVIPEPSTAILAGLGLVGLCFRRRRK